MSDVKKRSDERIIKPLTSSGKKTVVGSRLNSRLSHERMSASEEISEYSIEETPMSEGEVIVSETINNQQKKGVEKAPLRGIMKNTPNAKNAKPHTKKSPSVNKETNERSSQTYVSTNLLTDSPRISKESLTLDSSGSEKRFLHLYGSPSHTRSFSPFDKKNYNESTAPTEYILRKTYSEQLLQAEKTASRLLLKGKRFRFFLRVNYVLIVYSRLVFSKILVGLSEA